MREVEEEEEEEEEGSKTRSGKPSTTVRYVTMPKLCMKRNNPDFNGKVYFMKAIVQKMTYLLVK